MSALTSVAGGVLLCALIGAFANQHYSWIALACAAMGTQLPHGLEQPWLTERFGPQTLTHSLLGLTIVGLFLSPLVFTRHSALVTVCLIGYASHLLLEAATERGVLLFYPGRVRAVLPRHPLSRVIPGSPRERRLRTWLMALWLVALPLNAVGLRGLLHRLIPVVQFAVEDAITYTSQGRRAFADFTGRFTDSQRSVCGHWEVLEPTSRASLLVEDPQGRRHVLGTHPHDTIQLSAIRVRSGPPVAVRVQQAHLHEQTLGDLFPLLPSRGRTYLIGALQTPDALQPRLAVDQFQPIQAGHQRVELRYATLDDIRAAHLGGLYVTDGDLLLRTLTDSSSEASAEPADLPRVEAPQRTVSVIIRHLTDPEEITVKPDQPVQRGDVLADLARYRSRLLAEQRAAHAQLRSAQAELAQVDIAQQQELAIKRAEDALAGIHRDLAGLRAKHQAERARVQVRIDAISATLDRLARELAATQVRAPAAGRILSVTLHQSTATLHLLANE